MQPPMHIGIFMGIGLRYRIDHHLRFLRAGAVIQIDQRLAIDHAPIMDPSTASILDCSMISLIDFHRK